MERKIQIIDLGEMSPKEAMKKIEQDTLSIHSHLELYKQDPEFADELGFNIE